MDGTPFHLANTDPLTWSTIALGLRRYVKSDLDHWAASSGSILLYNLTIWINKCTCHLDGMVEVEYMVNKLRWPEWEFRCNNCAASDIINDMILYGAARSYKIESFILRIDQARGHLYKNAKCVTTGCGHCYYKRLLSYEWSNLVTLQDIRDL